MRGATLLPNAPRELRPIKIAATTAATRILPGVIRASSLACLCASARRRLGTAGVCRCRRFMERALAVRLS